MLEREMLKGKKQKNSEEKGSEKERSKGRGQS